MNLCNDDHEEICYDGRDCPLCRMRDELKGEIADLEKQLAIAEFDQETGE